MTDLSNRRRITWASVGFLVVPVAAVLVLGLVGRSWYPSSDWAIEALRIRAVGTGHTPLVGAPSRFGWDHPGPLMFWLLAPAERLWAGNGILLGTAVLNIGALVATVWLVHRRAGRAAGILAGLTAAVLVHALTGTFVMDPWNPWIAVLPFLLFLVSAWMVASGLRPGLVLLAAAGTFCVQAHVGYAPLVGGVGLTAVAWRWVEAVLRRRSAPTGTGCDQPWHERWREPLVAAGIGVLLWLPPLIQQFTGRPGNISKLIDYFGNPPDKAVGWSIAVGIAGRQLAPIGPWVSGHENGPLGLLATASAVPALVVVAAVAVSAALCVRRGKLAPARLAALAIVGDAIGVFATSRVSGFVASYLVRWWWPLAALTVMSGVWCVAVLVQPHARRLARPIAAAALAATLLLSCATALATLPTPLPEAAHSTAIEHLLPQVTAALDRHHRYLLQSVDTVNLQATGAGLLVELDRRGYSVYGSPEQKHALGSTRVTHDRSLKTLLVVSEEDTMAGWKPPPGARRIATYDPLSPTSRDRAHTLEARIRRALGASAPVGPVITGPPFSQATLVTRGADHADVRELARLQQRGDGYTVYLSH